MDGFIENKAKQAAAELLRAQIPMNCNKEFYLIFNLL